MHRKARLPYLVFIIIFSFSLLLVPFLQAQDVADAEAETTEEPPVIIIDDPTAEPTVVATEEPTAAPTEEPTAIPTEEPTVEPTAEPTEEPTEEVTEPEPTAEPTPITDAFQDNFDDGDAAGWLLNGWQVTNGAGGFVLESTGAGAAASVDGIAWPHFLLSVRVRVPAGTFSLALRDGYSITLNSSGATQLLRLGAVVAEGTAPLDGNWAEINVQALGSMITVAANRAVQFSYTDAEPLGGAALVFGADSAGIRLDDVTINRLDAPEPVEATPEPTELPHPLLSMQLSPQQQALLTSVQQNGSIRVIVGLPGANSPAASAADDTQLPLQLAQIKLGRDQLISQLSASGAAFAMLGDSQNWVIPYVAFNVDEIGLITLLISQQAVSIEEDMLLELTLDSSTGVINADDAWAVGGNGSGHAVAVLDTGVQNNHPFLAGRVADEACFSLNLCPNGRFVQKGRGAASPARCLQHFPSINGDCSHGTHVSGIAAGYLSPTFSGVAPNAKIIGVQVFSYTGGSRPGAYTIDIVGGLNWIYSIRNRYKVASVNMSLGGGQYFSHCDSVSSATTTIITKLRNGGVATAISSGNDAFTTSMGFPACISTAVSVGSSTDGDAISSFSNRATFMTLFAPGSSITSSIVSSQYASWNGTSMAAPHVAGAFAVLRQANPGANVNQLVNALRNTGVPIAITGGSVPRINLRAALDQVVRAPSGRPALLTANNFTTNDNTPALNWRSIVFGYAYDLQVDNDRQFKSPEYSVSGVQPNHALGSSLPDGTYFWRVRATNPAGSGAWSASRKFIVDTTPTAAPTLRAPKQGTAQNNPRPNFTWTRPRTAVQFQIQIDNNADFGSPEFTSTGKQPRYRPTSPLGQDTYYWRVRAYDKAGNVSAWSAVWEVHINLARAPRHNTFINSRNGSATPNFTWTRLPGASQYELQIADGADFSTIVFSSSTNRTNYRVSGANALANGIYYWRVRPNTGSGFVTPDVGIYNVLTVSPPAPGRVRITAPRNNATVTPATLIEWNEVTYTHGGSLSYRIQVSDKTNFSNLLVEDSLVVTHSDALSGLAPGTYFVRVRTENQYGRPGNWSPRLRLRIPS